MKRLILLALFAAAAASAQPPAPEPALELARLLMQRDETLYDDADGGRLVVRLREALLATPNGCNPFLAECRTAAEAIARRYAPAFRTAERARVEAIVARAIAGRMSADEAARMLALLRSSDGERLMGLLGSLHDSQQATQRRRELTSGEGDVSGPLAEARALFRTETRDMPRAPPR
jgi:hypothetical protein